MDISQIASVFITGLFAGGLSCMVVQGGLLTASLAQRAYNQTNIYQKTLPLVSFLLAKLLVYTILGFLLGWIGSFFQLSIPLQIVLFLLAGIYMVATAANLLELHPFFRYIAFQPPHFLARLLHKQIKKSGVFTPVLLGLMTVFIPCGTTQAVMALSIASGNPIMGAALLFAFTLGTSPLFFLFGYLSLKVGDMLRQTFNKFLAFLILVFAVLTLNNALSLTGTSFTIDTFMKNIWCTVSFCNETVGRAVNEQTITITDNGYTPNTFTVLSGTNVKLHLNNIGANTCPQAFTIPTLGIQQVVQNGTSDSITFRAPLQKGDIYFMCSMGHYKGVIHVI